MSKVPRTYEEEVLAVLAYEFTPAERAESERKLKRRLREKKLGAFDPVRVDALRAFRNDLQLELAKYSASRFFVDAKGPYSALADWDLPALQRYLCGAHPDVPEAAIAGFLNFGVYLYYLR